DCIRDRNVTGVQTCALPIWVVDRVAADHRHARLLRDGETAGEDLLQQLVGEHLAGPAHEVDRHHRVAAHRVDVGQGVRGGDAAPVVGVVDHGGEEVRGGEDGGGPVGPADPHRRGVVAVLEPHDHLFVLLPGERRDDLLEIAGRDLRGAAAAVRHGGQPDRGPGQGTDRGLSHGSSLGRGAPRCEDRSTQVRGDSLGGGGVRVLVGAPVFKTGETEHLGLAGSIPVRLRQPSAAPRGVQPPSAPGGPVPAQPGEQSTDPRRRIPRTDRLLAHPAVVAATGAMGPSVVRDVVRAAQDRARSGQIQPEQVLDEVLGALGDRPAASLRPVLNATGVIVHTNLGRAPLSPAAREALGEAAGYTDVEFDLATGARARRGAGARAALLAGCPEAEDALVVNNGAAALLLATTALAGRGEVVLSRGELIEIGAGFRLPDLIASTGAQLREVGTTNRTHLADFTDALGPGTGCVLRIHTSNYRVIGFTSTVEVRELAEPCREAGVPLIADLGSGLLAPEPLLPDEPDAATALRDGADLVIASGDKLLGGPQAGILLGRREIIARLARHPLARAV